MLTSIRMEFEKARLAERIAEGLLKEAMPPRRLISFRRGNMVSTMDAEVIFVSGRQIKIKNCFSQTERWIDLDDVKEIYKAEAVRG